MLDSESFGISSEGLVLCCEGDRLAFVMGLIVVVWLLDVIGLFGVINLIDFLGLFGVCRLGQITSSCSTWESCKICSFDVVV